MPHMPDVKRFPCRHCGAKQGEPCKLPSGYKASSSHAVRKADAKSLVNIAIADRNDGRSRYV